MARAPHPSRPKVGINLLWLLPGMVGGSEEYALAFVGALAASRRVDLVLFCQPSLAAAHPHLRETAMVVIGPQCRNARSARLLAENTWMQRQVRRLGLDVVHHLGGTMPLTSAASKCSRVLTVYDIQPLTNPERFDPLKRAWLAAVLPRSIRRAEVICTLTHHVADKVATELDVDRDRLWVVPPGLPPRGAHRPEQVKAVLRRHRIDGPVLLYPAISYPHKNHEVVIRALPELLRRVPQARLVLTGRPGPLDADIDDLAKSLRVEGAVRRLGRIPKAELSALYEAATALVFPSVHEGFGLPLIEAMAHATPVVAAKASAIPEVVDGYGELLEPHDPDLWATTLGDLLTDATRQRKLSAVARQGAARFTWDGSTNHIADAYGAAAASEGR